jgi:hypothetical protein
MNVDEGTLGLSLHPVRRDVKHGKAGAEPGLPTGGISATKSALTVTPSYLFGRKTPLRRAHAEKRERTRFPTTSPRFLVWR